MTGFVVVGTDTDAGKTTFSLLFLSAFRERFAYWKPVETGESDTATVRHLVPGASVFEPLARFAEPVAPPLAARHEGQTMPAPAAVLTGIPDSSRPLLIESFGGPLSPFTDDALQIEWIAPLNWPVVLVGSSALGATGRTLATLAALAAHGVRPVAVVLLGPRDEYAEAQIGRHAKEPPVFALTPPAAPWTIESVQAAAREQSVTLADIVARLSPIASAENWVERDRVCVWHPYTSLRAAEPPLPVVSAENEFLHLADGRTLIDGISSWWTILHGHRHPVLMDALRSATLTLDHVLFAGATHPPGVAVAEALLALMPWPAGGRVFYSDNGSTAVEVALKMAYQFAGLRGEPERTLFLRFENSYHGDTFGAMAVGRDPLFFGRFEPFLFRTLAVPVDADALDVALTRHRGQVAGIILEPLVQGAGGMRMHSPQVLRDVWNVTRRHAVPFIADEVMTGFGRTGSLFAFEQAGITPDLVCVAKGLTGGVLPLAATLATPHIVEAFDTADPSKTFFHGHSFTANPLACAVARANLELLRTGDWRRNAARIERLLTSRLQPLQGQRGIRDVRVRGGIAAVELDASGGYLATIGPTMRRVALENGVLLRPLGNVLYALPPLNTSDASLQRIADAMLAATEAVLETNRRERP